MDLLKVFENISIQLIAEFQKAAQVKHPGGKGDLREDALRDFLQRYLPRKYDAGRGEVITSENKVSGELDIVIYDSDHCPLFIESSSHSVYPLESVYGAISIKSHLDSPELKDAYQNIVSLKKILPTRGFSYLPTSGMATGMGRAMPVTGIIAYGANRSLDAIAKQVKKLDAKLDDINLRPDFVAVIGLGVVGPREKLRGEFNRYQLPDTTEKHCELRKTGRHTLLRIYMQLLDELNSIQLKPLDLQEYFNMPRIEGPHRVRKHDKFMHTPTTGSASVVKITPKAIAKIVKQSKEVTYRQHLMNTLGQLPHGVDETNTNLDIPIYEFNPSNKPPFSLEAVTKDSAGNLTSKESVFHPMSLEIDGKNYAVDLASLDNKDFIENNDLTVDELMSI